MIRLYIAIVCIIITYPMNHIDLLFPEFTEFSFFGRKLSIVEGLTSSDLIWTIAQKVNIILILFATHLLLPNFPDNPFIKWLINLVIYVIMLLNVYLAVSCLYNYTVGFDVEMFTMTFVAIVVTLFFAFFFLTKLTLNITQKNKPIR